MINKKKYGIPVDILESLYRDYNRCAYCQCSLIFPYDPKRRKQSSTIEHLNREGPFYWKEGLSESDLVICCSSCNSSRGIKLHQDWFRGNYCKTRGISSNSVDFKVKEYLKRK